MFDPLIAVRTLHFAASASVGGALAFLVLVARPTALAATAHETARTFECRCLRMVWLAFALLLASGVAWFMLQIGAMSGLSLAEALDEGMAPVVLFRTHFGNVSMMRLGLAALLAISLVFFTEHRGARLISTGLAALLLATLAGTGHAAGTPGAAGILHLTADALHCLAAGVWIGGLIPLAWWLAAARRHNDHRWILIAHGATRRFSAVGIAAVVTLMATGIFNAWILLGSLRPLTRTDYGRLLVVKLALFAAMLGLAAVNRFCLTPNLAPSASGSPQMEALRRLARNSTIEFGLGLAVFAIVGALGTVHPEKRPVGDASTASTSSTVPLQAAGLQGGL